MRSRESFCDFRFNRLGAGQVFYERLVHDVEGRKPPKLVLKRELFGRKASSFALYTSVYRKTGSSVIMMAQISDNIGLVQRLVK